jgi:hypothetical protein
VVTQRQKPPNRRKTETHTLETTTGRYHVSFGYGSKDRLREVFIRGSKSGSDMDLLLDDASVVLSLALQHGVPPDQLLHSLVNGREEGARSTLAKAIALMQEKENG